MSTQANSKDISRFTRTLWWIAGASPEILEKYPSEYAKFSAIGMTISMTCVVAFVSGMAAAWYFSSSVLASIAFGFFWALLIFCIDRALVVTMKKSIHSKTFKEKLIEALKIIVPRAVLAVLVALLMSIPLELIVFEDIINEELPNYESKKQEDSSKIGYDAIRKAESQERERTLSRQSEDAQNDFDDANEQYAEATNSVASLEQQISSKKTQLNRPNTSRYNNANSEVMRSKAALNSADINDNQRRVLKAKISSNQGIMNEEKANWNKKLTQEIESLEPKLIEAQKRAVERKQNLDAAKERKREVSTMMYEEQKILSNADAQVSTKVRAIDSIQKHTNKFIRNYSVLEYAVYDKIIEKIPIPKASSEVLLNDSTKTGNKSVKSKSDIEYKEVWHYRNRDALIMLWLIRILFFVFEMMPTVVKAVSKPGPYERECEAQDEQMEQFFTSSAYSTHMNNLLVSKLAHEKQLAEDRQNAERNLHDHILMKIQDAQKEVAVAAIDKWRKEHIGASLTEKMDSRQSKDTTSDNINGYRDEDFD